MGKTRVALLVVLLIAGLGETATTSRLTGTVVDTDHAALPGVTVQLWSEVLIGGRQTAVTDSNGRVAFNLLPPGPYSLRAELPGFVPVELAARVALDTETQVRIVMVAREFSGTIEVTGEAPLIDTTDVSGGDSYDAAFLRQAAVGMDGRSWMNALFHAAGVVNVAGGTPTNVMPGKNPQVMGSLQTDNVYLLDWLNTTDPVTSTFGAWLNYDAIQEVSVLETGLDAEYGQALGGVINLVTKSGGNQLAGSVDVRYRDQHFNESGEHFDPDDNVSSLREATATLGGPVLRDRMWFFAAVGNRLEEETPTDAALTREVDRWDWIGKLTWQVSGSTRAILKLSGYPVEDTNFNAGRDVAVDAGGTLDYGTSVYQAELHSVLTDSLLLSLQAGFNRGHVDVVPTSGDFDSPAYYNENADLNFWNYAGYSFSDRDSDQYRTNLTWFVDDLLGRHELKTGIEYRLLDTLERDGLNGDGFHEVIEADASGCPTCDQDGDGFVDQTLLRRIEGFGDPNHARGELWSAFAQDSWRPVPNLTFKAGVRWDGVEHTDQFGDRVIDFDEWQPRLGLAWDPWGNGKSVLRASWGRTMHPASTNMDHYLGYAFGSYEYTGSEYRCALAPGNPFCDPDWAAEHADLVTVDANGSEHYWYLVGYRSFYEAHQSVDTMGVGHLEAQWAETFTVAVERQLGDETSLELIYVNKNTRDLIEDTCSNNTWIWDESEPDPDFNDPGTWTDPESCQHFVVANVPGLRRDYDAYIAKLETRLRWLHAKVSYTYASARGNSTAEAWINYQSPFYDVYPSGWINTNGSLVDDYRHQVKLSGYAALPWDVNLSLAYSWRSAPPRDVAAECEAAGYFEEAGYDPVLAEYCEWSQGWPIYLEPRGSRRGRAEYNLDLGLAKTIRISGVNLELNLAVLNVWGDERPKEYQEQEFTGVPVGTPTSYTEPRRYQLGLRVEF